MVQDKKKANYQYSNNTYNSRCSKSYNHPKCGKNQTTPTQEAPTATTVLDTSAMVEQKLPVPETVLPVHPSTNESLLGASYLNNHVHQVIPNTNVSVCSSDS